jgi:hypothetical protein
VALFPLLILALMIGALIDAIVRREDQVKHLPKFAWIVLIVLLPLIGSVLWFTIGREWSAPRESLSFGDPRRWSNDAAPAEAPVRARETRTTEQQLADLEREERIAALEAEVRARRARDGGEPS